MTSPEITDVASAIAADVMENDHLLHKLDEQQADEVHGHVQEAVLRHLSAALAAGAPMSRVKPLEWRTRYFDAEVTIEQASAGTLYQIRDYKGRFWLDIGPDDVGYATLEAAKAAAQADYEARILSALEPAPVQQAAPSGEGE